MIRLIQGLLLAMGLLLLATPAQAHSELLGSTPADGEVLTSAPPAVSLQFNEAISPAGLQVVAQGPEGPVTLGTPIIDGAVVQVPWPTDTTGGNYRVAYRVVSADGHPIDGSIGFSYPVVTTTAETPAASPEPTDLGASALASQDLSASTTQDSANGGFPWWLAVGAVIVGVGIGATIARTMRSRAQASDHTSSQ